MNLINSSKFIFYVLFLFEVDFEFSLSNCSFLWSTMCSWYMHWTRAVHMWSRLDITCLWHWWVDFVRLGEHWEEDKWNHHLVWCSIHVLFFWCVLHWICSTILCVRAPGLMFCMYRNSITLCICIVWVTLFSFTAVKALYSVKSDSWAAVNEYMGKQCSLVQLTWRRRKGTISHKPEIKPKTYALSWSFRRRASYPDSYFSLSFLSRVSCTREHPLAIHSSSTITFHSIAHT